MAFKVGTIYAEIKGKTDDLDKSLTSSHKKAEKTSKTIAAIGAAAVAAAAGGLYLMASKIKESVKHASDLEEATSKFNVVFAGQTAAASKWAQTLVKSYGMSSREAKEFLGSIQDLLVPMGMSTEVAGRMSNELVKLAVDLGSFNNRETADVMNDITSALTGEYQTMKKYGVMLSAVVVEQKALALGLADTKNELTASHKAQAAYQIIFKQSEAAIGDWIRTSDGYANTTKRLNSAWEDLSATIGVKFLGSATAAKAAMADLLETTNTMLVDRSSLESDLAAVEERIKQMNKTREELESDHERKVIAREKREEQRKADFIKRNMAPQLRLSAEILANEQATSEKKMKLGADEYEMLVLQTKRQELLYQKYHKSLETDRIQASERATLIEKNLAKKTADDLEKLDEKRRKAADKLRKEAEENEKEFQKAQTKYAKEHFKEVIDAHRDQSAAVEDLRNEDLSMSNRSQDEKLAYLMGRAAQMTDVWEQHYYNRSELSELAAEREKITDDKLAEDKSQALDEMYSGMTVRSDGYYTRQLSHLDTQKEEYEKLKIDQNIIDQWYTDQSNVLMDEQLASSNNFFDGVRSGHKELLEDQKTWADAGKEVYSDFAQGASQILSDQMFNAITGEYENFSDAWDDLWKGMLKTLVDVVAEMVVVWAVSQVAQIIGGATGWGASWDVGAWEVKEDHVALVHEGELIVPANMAENVRNILGETWDQGTTGMNLPTGVFQQRNSARSTPRCAQKAL